MLAELETRGLVHDSTDRESLAARLAARPVVLYCGFDPTADSLHIGNLVPLLLLRRFQLFGHRPIALAGGATGMIGDPSGKSEERAFLDDETLDRNLAAVKQQLELLLDFEPGPAQARLVDNRDWTAPMGVLDFLRDVGKHITVNTMLGKESIKARVHSEHGISYTEFSYMLLQAYDFHVLHETHGCELQVGGSDQWGNITAGIDLIRRRSGGEVHGLTVPLMTRADGAKFGKSEGGNIWLSADKTSPYRFFQYWMNVDDRDVEGYLLRLTLLPADEVRSIVAAHEAAPEQRGGQRALARELTELVHGSAGTKAAEAASAALFSSSLADLDAEALATLAGEIPTTRLPASAAEGGLDLLELFVRVGLAKSKGEVRRDPKGFYVNNRPREERTHLQPDELICGEYLLLRRGKTTYHLVMLLE
ncbi:MAG: tyrosine--tRNA ligase [Actinobacteria bacterium]|nr:MAG: tyrosine--tRNA ligase [Actinomycetota bacterium]RIK05679.1 MAG: tyrosine--tRNA ligase [Acidobacteriota bacterium]